MMKLLVFLLYGLLFSGHTLQLEIYGIKKIRGDVMIAVYDSEQTFLTRQVIASGAFKVTGEQLICQLKLPYGRYAISIYHDVNADGVLNSNVFRVPKEPTGFSNNARSLFGPPNFEDASFDFHQERQVIRIKLN